MFFARTLPPTSVTISPLKLDPLKELELLRQQQEQLQKLQQLEKHFKQTSSASSTESTASLSSSTNTSKAETATHSSWSQDRYTSQSTLVQDSNKMHAGFQNQSKYNSTVSKCLILVKNELHWTLYDNSDLKKNFHGKRKY